MARDFKEFLELQHQCEPMRSPQNNNVANEGTLTGLSDDPANFAEVRKAIHKLKNNEAVGDDSIPSNKEMPRTANFTNEL